MALTFTPKTEQQLSSECNPLLPDGQYPFEVAKAEEMTSKKTGQPMLKLKLIVHHNGSKAFIDDYLLTSNSRMEWKLRGFCATANLLDAYHSGSLSASDCTGRSGWVIIKTDPEKTVDGKTFEAKNSVKSYVGEVKQASSVPADAPIRPPPTEAQMANQTGADSDVPF
jgi:hypothetical protein